MDKSELSRLRQGQRSQYNLTSQTYASHPPQQDGAGFKSFVKSAYKVGKKIADKNYISKGLDIASKVGYAFSPAVGQTLGQAADTAAQVGLGMGPYPVSTTYLPAASARSIKKKIAKSG